MRAPTLLALAGLLVALPQGGGLHASRPSTAATASPPRLVTEPNALPRVMTRHYRMAGRIRPLLFWIGRDDVGLASVVWRAGSDGGRGYELLVGTDPARAPRGLNRWGYIAEQSVEARGSLLALMTQASGTSFEDAERQAGTAGADIRAIRSEVAHGSARWQTARLRPAGRLTIHDVETAITRARHDTASSPLRQKAVAATMRSGFLVAVAELVDAVVRARANERPDPVPYVFGQGAYELRVLASRATRLRLETGDLDARHAEFEIRNLGTRAKTRFDMTIGLRDELAGVPLLIAWQPRWWLKLELHLDASPPDAPAS